MSSSGALSLTRLIPTPPPLTQVEARLQRLVERIKRDDLLAFEELYTLTKKDVARVLTQLLGRRNDLEDLVQETYIRLLKSVRTFRGDSQFRTFLYRVCSNVALMHLRWWRRRREDFVDTVPEEVSPGLTPEQAAQAAESQRLVHKALATLSAKKRIVFVYHELQGLGPEEISQITGCSYNTVRSRLFHAREDFTRALEKMVRP